MIHSVTQTLSPLRFDWKKNVAIFRRFLAHVYYHLAESDVVFTRLYQGLKHTQIPPGNIWGRLFRFEHLGSPHIAVLGVVHFYLSVNRLMN